MHKVNNSECWECKRQKGVLVSFDGLNGWNDNAEICIDCLGDAASLMKSETHTTGRKTLFCPGCHKEYQEHWHNCPYCLYIREQ